MATSLIPQSEQGITDEQEEDLGSFSSFGDGEAAGSSLLDFMDDATSSPSSIENPDEEQGPVFDMSNLLAQLPFKRGLSKHFHGKSQSFTSMSSVRSLEDLGKRERPYKKKLISSSTTCGGLDCNKALSCSRTITKKPSRASCFSSSGPKRQSFLGSSRPPINPHRSSGNLISTRALLFA